jgi:enamine deaminase RidA (YjgF/YER057c/UK114 family)
MHVSREDRRASLRSAGWITAVALLLVVAHATLAADITRYPQGGGSRFPIARAVEVPPGSTLVIHSGMTPSPANPAAPQGTPEYWGNTKTQSLSVFARIKESLDSLGLGFGDVVSMTVYLVGDPAMGGKMDFAGFMEAYTQFYGTADQPRLPARSTVQVASLVQPGMLVEIEVTLARPPK